jgi:hypothetical protein
MFKQTEPQYQTVLIGFGTGSIYEYGCYLVSFVNGLNQKGYSFTPESMNDLLKVNSAWVGPFKNYIDTQNLHRYLPAIFNSYNRIDPWNDIPSTNDLLNSVVVCRVDARAIGGSGTHYLALVGIEDGIAVINDPWTGRTEKITVTYGNYGDILGIEVFDVTPFVAPRPQPTPPVVTPTVIVPPVVVPQPEPIPQPASVETPPTVIVEPSAPIPTVTSNTNPQPLPTVTTSTNPVEFPPHPLTILQMIINFFKNLWQTK